MGLKRFESQPKVRAVRVGIDGCGSTNIRNELVATTTGQTVRGMDMSTHGYEPKHRTTGAGRTAKKGRSSFRVAIVAGLLVAASLMYAPAYGVAGLLGGLAPSETGAAEQEAESKVAGVDPIEEFDNSNSEVAPPALPESDPAFIVDFFDPYGFDDEDFACHDDSFDGTVWDADGGEWEFDGVAWNSVEAFEDA